MENSNVNKLVRALPRKPEAQVIERQLLRSATSVAANYRAVCRAKSKADFVSKLGNVIEEADESCFWLELIIDSELMSQNRVQLLLDEANELAAIFVASQKTSSRSLQQATNATK